ncbi:unnamed protein product [Calypogeia fissa]
MDSGRGPSEIEMTSNDLFKLAIDALELSGKEADVQKPSDNIGPSAMEEIFGRLRSLSESDILKLAHMKVSHVNGGSKLTVLGHLCVSKPCSGELLQILLREANVNVLEELNSHSFPLLHLAAYCSNYVAVEVLCRSEGINLCCTNSTNLNGLHMAVKSGDTQIARLLFDRVIDQVDHLDQPHEIISDLVNGQDDLGMTPLHYATWEGNESMTDTLLSVMEDVMNVNATELNGFTALHLASLNNDIGVLRKLLHHPDINVNATDNNGFTALHLASWNNHIEVVRQLLVDTNIDTTVRSRPQMSIFTTGPGVSMRKSLQDKLKEMEFPLLQFSVHRQSALHLQREEMRLRTAMSHFKPIRENEGSQEQQGRGDEHRRRAKLLFSYDRKSALHLNKEERRLRRAMSNLTELSDTEGRKGRAWPSSELLQQERRGEENRRRAAKSLFPTFDLNDNGKLTALHCAAWQGHTVIVATLVKKISSEARARTTLNALDKYGMSAVHYAVLRGDASIVEDLLSYSIVRGNVREECRHLTPLNMAYLLVKGDHLEGLQEDELDIAQEERVESVQEYKTVIGLLSEQPDVKAYTEGLYRDRQLFVDAANAILVGAALIASITFAGWLQPPLGYQPYYDTKYLLTGAAPPDTYASYATVGQHAIVQVFWVFNSLSFFFAIATVLLGACVVLPVLGKAELEAEVRRMRKLHIWTTLFLSFSVFYVLGAFIAAGFAAVPPTFEDQAGMIASTVVGGFVGLGALCYYLYRVITLINLILRAPKDEYGIRMNTKTRSNLS